MAVVHTDHLPAHLVEPTAVSEWLGNTNEDLVEYALDVRSAVETCNADKAALRRIWAESLAGNGMENGAYESENREQDSRYE